MRILLVDNYDSFTWNVYHLLMAAGPSETISVMTNDDPTIRSAAWDVLVLGPGPFSPSHSGFCRDLVESRQDRPVFGICLGLQILNEYFGGTTVRSATPTHGKTVTITHTDHPLFHNVPNPFAAARYNSLQCLPAPTSPLRGIAHADGEVMAMASDDHLIAGVQFHPDSFLTVDGKRILQNFLATIRRTP